MTLALTVLKWLIGLGLLVWLLGLVLDWAGPSAPLDPATAGWESPPDLDRLEAWLADLEAAASGVTDRNRRRVVWASTAGERTPVAVVYLHGFSAGPDELSPVPQRVADALGANLFLQRLSGHGGDGSGLGGVAAADWLGDAGQAVEIGAALGDRLLVIGTSTGAVLGVLAASDLAVADRIDAMVLVSPNFRVAGLPGRLIEWPGVRAWGPRVVGPEHEVALRTDGQREVWLPRYPTAALAALGAVTRRARSVDLAALEIPALFFVADGDSIVDPRSARRAAARWGGPSVLVPVTLAEGDDPARHVLAGDLLSPSQTQPMVNRILAFARQRELRAGR